MHGLGHLTREADARAGTLDTLGRGAALWAVRSQQVPLPSQEETPKDLHLTVQGQNLAVTVFHATHITLAQL